MSFVMIVRATHDWTRCPRCRALPDLKLFMMWMGPRFDRIRCPTPGCSNELRWWTSREWALITTFQTEVARLERIIETLTGDKT